MASLLPGHHLSWAQIDMRLWLCLQPKCLSSASCLWKVPLEHLTAEVLILLYTFEMLKQIELELNKVLESSNLGQHIEHLYTGSSHVIYVIYDDTFTVVLIPGDKTGRILYRFPLVVDLSFKPLCWMFNSSGSCSCLASSWLDGCCFASQPSSTPSLRGPWIRVCAWMGWLKVWVSSMGSLRNLHGMFFCFFYCALESRWRT